ncbi:NAD(P)H-dependent oxidoreductase [Hypericibacter adhaerens]|jgi:chromate reductase|uniref:NAD(P)H-dependent oxidoreductase n=1 Tax=Hypericibacter adhaerens TaxID=2602016 RepID=A0A5J6N5G1_9PROT|nr:NADPH-dependent FMN reductase [Hypericibacter adhaerens]QEX22176.1 NAD(P)H-dependent oxidoreductase [Hypericibacter adhaerens]
MKLAVLVGSLRKGSFNAALARALPALTPAGLGFETLPSVGLLPLYDADIQAAGFPEPVAALGRAIKAADGIVIVMPEYNYSVPGGLKNAIDWVSRLPDKPFAGKPVLIQTASISLLGGARAQYHLRQILVFLDAAVMNLPEVMVAQAQNKFDAASGELKDGPTRELIAKQLQSFAAFVRKTQAGAAVQA